MRLNTLAFTVGLAVMSASAYSAVTLDGRSLTQEQAWAAANGEEVVIAPEAMKHLTDSYNLVMTAARQGVEIYGLTVGVGLNKDHHLFDAKGELTDVAKKASIDFNRNILRSHSVGYATGARSEDRAPVNGDPPQHAFDWPRRRAASRCRALPYFPQ